MVFHVSLRVAGAMLVTLAVLSRSAGFVSPGVGLRPQAPARAQMQVTMAAQKAGFKWIPILPIDEAPTPGSCKSVFAADLDLCVAADDAGLLYVVGNKCPPANQPLSFSSVVGKTVKDPIFGTKIDLETGGIIDWCPSILGKVLGPILGEAPENGGVPAYKVRSSGGVLEAYVDVGAKADFEKRYWKGILDAQGKSDGGYY